MSTLLVKRFAAVRAGLRSFGYLLFTGTAGTRLLGDVVYEANDRYADPESENDSHVASLCWLPFRSAATLTELDEWAVVVLRARLELLIALALGHPR